MVVGNPNGQRTIRLEQSDLRLKSKEKSHRDLTRDDFTIPDLEWNGAKKIYFMNGDNQIKVIKNDIASLVVSEVKPDYIVNRELSDSNFTEVKEFVMPTSSTNTVIESKGLKQDGFILPKEVVTPYQMAINNMANYLKNADPMVEGTMDAFILSAAAAVIFCKAKEEIIMDIIKLSK